MKYDRHPTNPELQNTPIPEHPGHTKYIDIDFTEKKLIVTATDKFSKLAHTRNIKSKAMEDIKKPLHIF